MITRSFLNEFWCSVNRISNQDAEKEMKELMALPRDESKMWAPLWSFSHQAVTQRCPRCSPVCESAFLKTYLELLNKQRLHFLPLRLGWGFFFFLGQSYLMTNSHPPVPWGGNVGITGKKGVLVSCSHYLQVSWAGSCFLWPPDAFQITPLEPLLWQPSSSDGGAQRCTCTAYRAAVHLLLR